MSPTNIRMDDIVEGVHANMLWTRSPLTSSLAPFIYSALDHAIEDRHIRLLSLQPGGYGDIIRCRLSHSSLSQNPQYQALSYCWGPPDFDYKIMIENEATNELGMLRITKNLYLALIRIRQTTGEKCLWVDALCINRGEKVERGTQVSFMRHIYEKAETTLVWLGAASENSNNALALVGNINRIASILSHDLGERVEGTATNLWDLQGDRQGLPKPHEKIWYDLFAVLKRDWFYRSWVVQELAVSKEVLIMCGNNELEWQSLVRAINFLVLSKGFGLTLGMKGLQQLLSLNSQRIQFQDRGRTRHQMKIIHILLLNMKACATDPSDHLFAFHGFFEPGSDENSFLQPNYQKNCRIVYTEFAIQMLRHQRNLDIFTLTRVRAGRSNEKLYGLPTWVPDWSTEDLTEPFLWRQICPDFTAAQRPTYKASGDSRYDYALDRADGKLIIEGWVIDEINLVGAVLEESSDRTEIYNTDEMVRSIIHSERVFNSWEGVCRSYDTFTRYPTGETRMEAYWKTLLGGCLNGDADHMRSLFDKWFRKTRSMRLLQTFGLDQAWLLKLHIWIVPTIYYILSIFCIPTPRFRQVEPERFVFKMSATQIGHRRMIRTDQGLIGLAPPLAEPRDKVVLCKGGKLPLILRPRLDDWELIGECYVHGIMDGKLWNMLERRAVRDGPFWDLYRIRSSRGVFKLV